MFTTNSTRPVIKISVFFSFACGDFFVTIDRIKNKHKLNERIWVSMENGIKKCNRQQQLRQHFHCSLVLCVSVCASGNNKPMPNERDMCRNLSIDRNSSERIIKCVKNAIETLLLASALWLLFHFVACRSNFLHVVNAKLRRTFLFRIQFGQVRKYLFSSALWSEREKRRNIERKKCNLLLSLEEKETKRKTKRHIVHNWPVFSPFMQRNHADFVVNFETNDRINKHFPFRRISRCWKLFSCWRSIVLVLCLVDVKFTFFSTNSLFLVRLLPCRTNAFHIPVALWVC